LTDRITTNKRFTSKEGYEHREPDQKSRNSGEIQVKSGLPKQFVLVCDPKKFYAFILYRVSPQPTPERPWPFVCPRPGLQGRGAFRRGQGWWGYRRNTRAGRVEFCGDAAGAEAVCGAYADIFAHSVYIPDFFHQFGVWKFLGVFVVKAVDVAEKDEQIRAPENSGLGGEGIIFAYFYFLHGDGVVLVDDGNYAFVHKGKEG
jgi:hypothetical protein